MCNAKAYMSLTACGGEFTGDTGLIRSPYNPQPYPGNRECIYRISQPVGKAILLNFTYFDIEASSYFGCIFDYVEVRDGDCNVMMTGWFWSHHDGVGFNGDM